MYQLAFSHDTSYLVTAGEEPFHRLTQIPAPVTETTSQVVEWIQGLTGMVLDRDGQMLPLQ
jgi:hypothetical protein